VSTPEQAFRDAVRRAAKRALDIDPESIPLTYPPSADLGDLATPVCFELARVARRAPRELATAIVESLEPGGGIARVEIAGGGYINAFLDRTTFLRSFLTEDAGDPAPAGPKRIIEHTNINPNKAAHIGHLRNAVLGDTLVRCLRRLGRPVEVQNYIDDTGVQVADLVVGFRELRGEGIDEVRERYAEERLREHGERFDYVAWDLYAEVTRFYQEDETRKRHRADTLHAMEEGGNPVAELAAHVAHRMVQHHLRTMDRIDVRYDVLPRESDILALKFWERAFELLRESGAFRKQDEGKNAGCWVMDLPGVDKGAGEDQKVIVRSNGTVTYVGKDIAYQMWKFGLLGTDFHYRPFDWSPGEVPYALWQTSPEASPDASPPGFGSGRTVYNVIDTRQSYLQRVVALALRSLGHEEQADRSIHFSYEMVALTPKAVQALFPDQPLSDEELGKAYLEMSGRKGLGVRADDLLDALFERAEGEVRRRNPDHDDGRIAETARRIAVGALRYYMLRFTKNRVVAFDLDAALAFEGETGPYLQYSVVRAANILGKVAEVHGAGEIDPARLAAEADLGALPEDAVAEHWNLALQLSRVPAVLEQAVDALELSSVAKHAYVVAQAFNSFYHRYKVAQEDDPAVRLTRTAIVHLYRERMLRLLELMGIQVPDRM
jgi:arginyl-tRNA synthetase